MGTGRKQPSKVGQDRRPLAVASRSFERNSDVSARISQPPEFILGSETVLTDGSDVAALTSAGGVRLVFGYTSDAVVGSGNTQDVEAGNMPRAARSSAPVGSRPSPAVGRRRTRSMRTARSTSRQVPSSAGSAGTGASFARKGPRARPDRPPYARLHYGLGAHAVGSQLSDMTTISEKFEKNLRTSVGGRDRLRRLQAFYQPPGLKGCID
jgi:hypothetical protein